MALETLIEAMSVVQSRSPDYRNCEVADIELQRRVRNFLQNRCVPRSSNLDIEARNGVVTLRGTHHSFYHKQLCINCCQRVAGVVQLIDTTKVAPPRWNG
jgi:osmotically-inducible protein OsmY